MSSIRGLFQDATDLGEEWKQGMMALIQDDVQNRIKREQLKYLPRFRRALRRALTTTDFKVTLGTEYQPYSIGINVYDGNIRLMGISECNDSEIGWGLSINFSRYGKTLDIQPGDPLLPEAFKKICTGDLELVRGMLMMLDRNWAVL